MIPGEIMSEIPQEMADYSIYLNEVAARDKRGPPSCVRDGNGGSKLVLSVSVGCHPVWSLPTDI